MRDATKTVGVGLSGGVDSSVAAALLKEQGYEVIGISMEIFDGSVKIKASRKHACYGPGEKEDMERAASICKKIDIPFHVIDLRKEYRRYVIEYFRREYLAGRTPNPCVVCNRSLKFGFLLERAKEAGINFASFATGHYARIVVSAGRHLLKKAVDRSKDQTYFLHTLTPVQLSHTLFPLGAYTKLQVRKMARSLRLESAELPESQDFIDSDDYCIFFSEREIREGPIVDEGDRILGKHKGIVHYTIGQRRGLGIASDRPLYVKKIDAENNRIVVSGKEGLYSAGFIASGFNIIAVDRLDRPYKVRAKIRLKHEEAEAAVFPHGEGKVKVLFDEPQVAVTPGQPAVLYSGDTVFGGGIIEKAL